MYLIVYPNPSEPCNEDKLICETAETRPLAIEAAEQIAAKYRGVERGDVMILDASLATRLSSYPENHRCPHCGHVISIDHVDTGNLAYDEDEGLFKAVMSCPTCGKNITIWYDGDPDGDPDEDPPEFDHIDQYEY